MILEGKDRKTTFRESGFSVNKDLFESLGFPEKLS